MGRLMENIIGKAIKEGVRVKEDFFKKNTSKLIHLAEYISESFRNGRKLRPAGEIPGTPFLQSSCSYASC